MSEPKALLHILSDRMRLCLPSIITKRLDQMQRRWNGGYKTHHIFVRNLSNSLLALPVEVIVLIAGFLPLSSRVLLSLASKRLRVILTTHFDMTFLDQSEKSEFLLILERELPEYLTCRPCAWMYRWRSRESQNYRCPRAYDPHVMFFHDMPTTLCSTHNKRLSREMINLILKAHKYGPSHGLPPTHMDHECYTRRHLQSSNAWYHQQFEGLIVNREFFSHTSYLSINDMWNPMDPKAFIPLLAGLPVCSHANFRVASLYYKIWSQVRTWDYRQVFNSGTIKCNICATDVRICLTPWHPSPSWYPDGLVRSEASIWQNHGDRSPYERASFPPYGMLHAKLTTDTASRDLERDFSVRKWRNNFVERERR